MNPARQQLAAFTPVPMAGLAAAVLHACVRPGVAEAELAACLANLYGHSQVTLCGSGTQALQLAIRHALADRPGDGAVALPGFGCYDLASAAIGAGAQVHLYDIDPRTLAPDLDSLEDALRCGASVAVITPLFGIPIDWDPIREVARRHDTLLIEDAAQGHGGAWRGKPIGADGDLTVLSFGRGKGWTAGNGGALLSGPMAMGTLERSGLLAEFRAAVTLLAQSVLSRPAVYRIPASLPGLGLGMTRYRPPEVPAQMGRVGAATLWAARAAAAAEAGRRRRNAQSLLSLLDDTAALPVLGPADGIPGWLRLPVRLASGMTSFPDPKQAQRLGVARTYPTTLSDLPPIRAYLMRLPHIPGAAQLVRELVTFPTHSRIRLHEMQHLIARLPHPDRGVHGTRVIERMPSTAHHSS